MKVLEFKNIEREEGQIFYIRKYTCDATLDLPTSQLVAKISFSIEMNPFGAKDVIIDFLSDINYPSIPVKKALTDFIIAEDNSGHLTC